MIIYFKMVVVLLSLGAGYLLGGRYGMPTEGMAGGAALGLVAVMMDAILRRVKVGSVVGGVAGLGLGLLAARLLLVPFAASGGAYEAARLAMSAVLGYGGLIVGIKRGAGLSLASLVRNVKGHEASESVKVLDTSVIIDGRIADICETGFIEGEFLVPQFILHELQHIADSPDSLKRARGRRGLDILHRIQKMPQITVTITEQDFPKIREVDAKLVALGQSLGAKVITNDFNLNKVAGLQGVSVLNINELANAIKPVVLPGESLRVFIIKEGKEHNQGVAYLEDGTMVVIDNGRKLIGKNIDVTVTSVLQTTAGRMIFTKTREEYERDEARVPR